MHIALGVEPEIFDAMLEKAKAEGREVRGPVDHRFVRSIYFRDPNGYVIEMAASTGKHGEIMDPGDLEAARGAGALAGDEERLIAPRRIRYIRRLVELPASLSPQLVEAIAQGRQSDQPTATRLTELDLPLDWAEQRLFTDSAPVSSGYRQPWEGKMPKISRRLFAAAVALLAASSSGAAGAAEIKVLCSGAMRAVLQQLAPAFEKSSSHKVVIEYATAGKVEEKVVADEGIDVAILTKPRAEKLVRVGKLVGGTHHVGGEAQELPFHRVNLVDIRETS